MACKTDPRQLALDALLEENAILQREQEHDREMARALFARMKQRDERLATLRHVTALVEVA